MTGSWRPPSDDLTSLLGLDVPPPAMTFSAEPPADVPKMTCALPAGRLTDVVAALEANGPAGATVRRHAAEDAARFS